jgi:hypothetical protein
MDIIFVSLENFRWAELSWTGSKFSWAELNLILSQCSESREPWVVSEREWLSEPARSLTKVKIWQTLLILTHGDGKMANIPWVSRKWSWVSREWVSERLTHTQGLKFDKGCSRSLSLTNFSEFFGTLSRAELVSSARLIELIFLKFFLTRMNKNLKFLIKMGLKRG